MDSSSLGKMQRAFVSPAVLFVMLILAAESAGAQSGAEYATTLAKTGGIKPPPAWPTAILPQGNPPQQKGAHLPAREKKTSELGNRRHLEGQAGKEAGKLLIRSAPSGADVWIDELAVGKTPLLLIMHPGTYTVKVRALGADSAEQRVGILSEKSYEVVLSLRIRYPAQIRLP